MQAEVLHGRAKFRGVLNTIQHMSANGGFKGVFSGFGPAFSATVVSRGFQLFCYDLLYGRQLAGSVLYQPSTSTQPLTPGVSLLAASTLLVHPLDTLSKCMIVRAAGNKPPYRNVMHCFREVTKLGGSRALWGGLGFNAVSTTIGAFLLYVGGQFGGLAQKRGRMRRERENRAS